MELLNTSMIVEVLLPFCIFIVMVAGLYFLTSMAIRFVEWLADKVVDAQNDDDYYN